MDESIKVLIVEDEFPIAFDLETRLSRMGYDVTGIAVNYSEAMTLLAEKEYDIILLDINLEEKKSGVDVGIVVHNKFHCPVIFITAYSDQNTFDQALKANPMGFITKPFNDDNLHRTIVLARQNFRQHNQSSYGDNSLELPSSRQIFIKEKGILRNLSIDTILWAEAMENYTIINCADEKYVVNVFLKDVIEKLEGRLVRIHRSFAVALDKISSIEDNTVYIGKNFFPLSYSYKNDLLKQMKLL